jgi:hypothetical protein
LIQRGKISITFDENELTRLPDIFFGEIKAIRKMPLMKVLVSANSNIWAGASKTVRPPKATTLRSG